MRWFRQTTVGCRWDRQWRRRAAYLVKRRAHRDPEFQVSRSKFQVVQKPKTSNLKPLADTLYASRATSDEYHRSGSYSRSVHEQCRSRKIGETMCLAVPGQVLSIEDDQLRTATVSFGGVTKSVSLALVPEAGIGDYVIDHVGFAISRLDEEAARRTLETYADLAASGSPDGTDGEAPNIAC